MNDDRTAMIEQIIFEMEEYIHSQKQIRTKKAKYDLLEFIARIRKQLR